MTIGLSLKNNSKWDKIHPVSYTHLRAHETDSYLVCRLLLEKKKKNQTTKKKTKTKKKKIKKKKKKMKVNNNPTVGRDSSFI